MPSILRVPKSRSNTKQVKLPKEGLVIDSRANGLDPDDWEFECTIEGDMLTITRLNHVHGLRLGQARSGWSMLHFRVYDPSAETVPAFNSKSYRYHGMDNEYAPRDVEEVIVDDSVIVIQNCAFSDCESMKRCTMGDNVVEIESEAFSNCIALEALQLSRRLEFIGKHAFLNCESIRALFIPENVEEIDDEAFDGCSTMKFLILPTHDRLRLGNEIVNDCGALLADESIQYRFYPDEESDDDMLSDSDSYDEEHIDEEESPQNVEVNRWLIHRYDSRPLIRLCVDPFVTAQMILDFIQEHGTRAFYQPDDDDDDADGLLPLHILVHYNEFAGNDAIMTCFDANPSALLSPDAEGVSPLDLLWIGHRFDNMKNLIQDLCVKWYNHVDM